MIPTLQNILYVEDDADIRQVTLLALELIGGLSVKACASGAEAGAADNDFRPDLLLLDVMMPEMDGPTTLAHLRRDQRFSAVPAMFFTAKVRPEEVARLQELGAIGVIGKPFDPQTLVEELRRKWDAHHGG